jgi:hypothetical protein
VTSTPPVQAKGGWIKDAPQPDHAYREVLPGTDLDLDPSRLDYFRDYLDRYFNDRLVRGQGVEQILGVLTSRGRFGAWADLGAGTTTLFWAIGASEIASVDAIDVCAEALSVLGTFVNGSHLPPCYREALALAGRSDDHLTAIRRLPWRYHQLDGLRSWPSEFAGRRFDTITAIGLLGLNRTAEGYISSFCKLPRVLHGTGRIVGADWIRSAAFVAEEGHDNGYLSEDIVRSAASAAGMRVCSLCTVSIEGDDCYDRVIVWSVEPAVAP